MKMPVVTEGREVLPIREVLCPEQSVAILDAGAQYVDLIQKACTRLGFRADILPLDTEFGAIEQSYGAFIVSGGPANSHTEGAPMPDPDLWKTKKGVFGACYGQHAMALAFGGRVESGISRQDGAVETTVNSEHPLFARTKRSIKALFTHGDFVTEVPPGFETIGQHELSNGQTVISAIAKDNFVSVQFHPEVFDETPFGYDIFKAFLEDICKMNPNSELLEQQAEQDVAARKAHIAERAGDKHVIAFASGGIDSTVATMLAGEVIAPEKLHVFYFDNGFMRDEDDQVIEMLQELGINVQKLDATASFEQARTLLEDGSLSLPLLEISDPTIKRKIIGKKFAELKDDVAGSLGLDTTQVMLLQGTNAADRIESGFSLAGGKTTEQIKEHHNQVKEIKDLEKAGLLIEPLNDIHKDEIRRIGEYMGLPEEVVWRHPFPGPGNAIRILCGNEQEYFVPAPDINATVREFVARTALSATLLPTRSVGVGGDARSYVLPVALQGEKDWPLLERLATEIPAYFKGQVNRVVVALGDTPIENYQITTTTLGQEERSQLRLADHIVFEEMRRFELLRKISQCPIILLPITFSKPGDRSIVLRPVRTSTFLTAKALVPGRDVNSAFVSTASSRLLAEIPGISQVFLELTNKPPATTEWE